MPAEFQHRTPFALSCRPPDRAQEAPISAAPPADEEFKLEFSILSTRPSPLELHFPLPRRLACHPKAPVGARSTNSGASRSPLFTALAAAARAKSAESAR